MTATTGRYLFEEYAQAGKRKCLYFVSAQDDLPRFPAHGLTVVVHGALCNPISVPISERQRQELLNTLTFNPDALDRIQSLRTAKLN